MQNSEKKVKKKTYLIQFHFLFFISSLVNRKTSTGDNYPSWYFRRTALWADIVSAYMKTHPVINLNHLESEKI